MLLVMGLWLAAPGHADEVPPLRVIHGGLGYSFTMQQPRPGDAGFLAPAPGQQRHVVRARVEGDFFPERELVFTPASGELLKIEGKRRAGAGTSLTAEQCSKDRQLVVESLRDKYPSLEFLSETAAGSGRSQLCEGSTRLPGHADPIGAGRCIHLECTTAANDKATLTITYWNVDIYARAQREEREQGDEIRKRLGSERGLDPAKL